MKLPPIKTLEDLRKRHGFNLEQAAARLKISRTYLYYLEKHQRTLSLERAEAMVKLYDTDLQTILQLYRQASKSSRIPA